MNPTTGTDSTTLPDAVTRFLDEFIRIGREALARIDRIGLELAAESFARKRHAVRRRPWWR